jgi:hypothetical protein
MPSSSPHIEPGDARCTAFISKRNPSFTARVCLRAGDVCAGDSGVHGGAPQAAQEARQATRAGAAAPPDLRLLLLSQDLQRGLQSGLPAPSATGDNNILFRDACNATIWRCRLQLTIALPAEDGVGLYCSRVCGGGTAFRVPSVPSLFPLTQHHSIPFP